MIKTDPIPYRWWALLGICLLSFTAFLDATIVDTALPFIQEALQATILQLQWITTIFTLILSMTMIAIGKLADRWRRTLIFYGGIVLFAIAALVAEFSSTIEQLVFWRGLQSLGAPVIFVTSAALLSELFPEEERSKA